MKSWERATDSQRGYIRRLVHQCDARSIDLSHVAGLNDMARMGKAQASGIIDALTRLRDKADNAAAKDAK